MAEVDAGRHGARQSRGGHGRGRPGCRPDRFPAGMVARGCRADFIAPHWHGEDFRTPEAVRRRYRKPIRPTEYALIDFSQGIRFPTPARQADFVAASAKPRDALPDVRRHAWCGLGAGPPKPSSGLVTDSTTATAADHAYQAARWCTDSPTG
ncbi:glycosyl hydrolase [Streptomyces sp. NPDC017673]|uniref:glycosyl hydrolase n=1 Tax=unclassified Streptomyces TaxID=2593676 RepID=UPI00378BDFC8